MRRRRNPEIIAGRVAADGTIISGDGFTAQRTGTGALSVRIVDRSTRLVSWQVTTVGAIAWAFTAVVAGGGGFDSQSYTPAGAAIDSGIAFVAVGVQQ